jgi:two-component system chemotaxis response regulator CheB
MTPSNVVTTSARRAPGLVVVAASAGGISALKALLAALPVVLPAALAIVLHRTAAMPNLIAAILGHASRWPIKPARDGELPAAGVVYVAPPDAYLTVTPERTFRLVDDRRVRHVLSSADPLFETAAAAFGERLIAIVLTGGDHDGAGGVQAVARAGGAIIAQDPASAEHPSMPRSAIATGAVDAVLPLERIAAEVARCAAGWRLPRGPGGARHGGS